MPSSFGSAVTAATIALIARARTGHAEPHLLIRQTLGSQKCVSQPCVSGRGRLCGLAIACKELGCETDGGAHRDLLAEDRAHGQFKSIPSTGTRRPGRAAISGARAVSRNRCSLIVCGSAERFEHPTQPHDNCRQARKLAEPHTGNQRILVSSSRHLDGADLAIDIDDVAVRTAVDQLHARDSTSSEEADHYLPVIGAR
jgi:hypothetical protein